jgi:hypothetical protein
VRSIREVFLHIAHGNRLLVDLAEKATERAALIDRLQKQLRDEKEALSKDGVIEKLAESFALVHRTVEPLHAGALGSPIEFFGRKTTRRGVYIALTAHIAEHLGQLIAYARINGIAPPWSE